MATNSLKDDLSSSAARFAETALGAFLEDDFAVFFLHAGTALEHLSKAHLVSLNASFIAAKDFNSLLLVCGFETQAGPRMRTISLKEALGRSGRFIPPLNNLSEDLDLLVEVRGGVAHVGRAERSFAETVLIPFLKASDLILEALGTARATFWTDLEWVDSRLSESNEAAAKRASDALAAARLRFQSRYSALEPDVHDSMLKVVEDSVHIERYRQDRVSCPACERLAVASGGFVVLWEADWDVDDFREPWLVGIAPTVRIYPKRLDCPVCGLKLEGEEELRAAGIERSWELNDVDPDDFTFDEDD